MIVKLSMNVIMRILASIILGVTALFTFLPRPVVAG
jgi:hypothetical protein